MLVPPSPSQIFVWGSMDSSFCRRKDARARPRNPLFQGLARASFRRTLQRNKIWVKWRWNLLPASGDTTNRLFRSHTLEKSTLVAPACKNMLLNDARCMPCCFQHLREMATPALGKHTHGHVRFVKSYPIRCGHFLQIRCELWWWPIDGLTKNNQPVRTFCIRESMATLTESNYVMNPSSTNSLKSCIVASSASYVTVFLYVSRITRIPDMDSLIWNNTRRLFHVLRKESPKYTWQSPCSALRDVTVSPRDMPSHIRLSDVDHVFGCNSHVLVLIRSPSLAFTKTSNLVHSSAQVWHSPDRGKLI